MNNLEKIYLSTFFLCEFRKLKENEVFKSFVALLLNLKNLDKIELTINSYTNFVMNLKDTGYNDFTKYIKEYLIENTSKIIDEKQIEKEFDIIKNVLNVDYKFIKNFLIENYQEYSTLFDNLAEFQTSIFDIDMNSFKIEKATTHNIFEEYQAFIFGDDLEIRPVLQKETTYFSSLKGYNEQKKVLYNNTKALLEGKRVNNILLYGDNGCGKSSSVRALLNELPEIKIVQIFKNNLINLDELYSRLEKLPYKFIIFADDISFDESDGVLSTMKAILEGSLVSIPSNVTIYATSNRRHLVRESFQSRTGDEIHLKDTINEISSLSERFGINLFFQRPTNDEFNNIVLELAKDNNIELDEKILLEKAQRTALIKGSRSPRIAKQFIENLLACVNI